MTSPIPEALAAAQALATRLTEPTADTGPGRRSPQSLAGGAAGIALLHIERSRTGHAAPNLAHTWLTVAAQAALSAGPNAGLFFGAPALGFITHAAADRPGKYDRALQQLDTGITKLTRHRLGQAHQRIDQGERPLMAEFDLIRGLTGLGTYHLIRAADQPILKAVLAYLVRLTEPPAHPRGRPGWWTDVSLTGEPSDDFPGGHGNVGMAHGIAAPLALLALATLRGVLVDGQIDAIQRICAWLDDWEQHAANGLWWPGYITADQADHQRIGPEARQRPSWCYGVAGVARALQLAGQALADDARTHKAETAMLTVLRDPEQLARLPEAGLCHGLAGLYQSAWRMAEDAATPTLSDHLPHLVDRLLARLPTADKPGELLDGYAGTALALHTAGTGKTPSSSWDAFLLLA